MTATQAAAQAADQALQVAEGQYRAGVTTFLQVTTAQTTAAQADVAAVTALYTYESRARGTAELARVVDPEQHGGRHVMTGGGARMRRVIVMILIAVVVVGGAVYGYRQLAGRRTRVNYVTAKVAYADVTSTVSETGTVNPVNEIQIGTQVSGTIATLNVDYNSKVTPGEVLTTLDPTTVPGVCRAGQRQRRSRAVHRGGDSERHRRRPKRPCRRRRPPSPRPRRRSAARRRTRPGRRPRSSSRT